VSADCVPALAHAQGSAWIDVVSVCFFVRGDHLQRETCGSPRCHDATQAALDVNVFIATWVSRARLPCTLCSLVLAKVR